ncbi:hypothetical protein HMPREF2815_05095, partial [Bacteroides sp. HMSC068A09]
MRNLQIIGNVPQVRRESNFGEYAEEAVIIEEPVKPKRVNHFIEANSVEVTLDHLKNDNVIPVFSKDNELTISHPQFIETVWEAANSFYSGEQIEQPDIRCSHVIKGRKPEAINKPKNLLTEADTTQYYERCAFAIDIPSIYEDVSGNRLNLSIVGVRALNRENLATKKSPELFRLAVSFKNTVCCNMCVSTDGYKDDIKVMSTKELFRATLELLNNFNTAKNIHLLQTLGNSYLTEHQ